MKTILSVLVLFLTTGGAFAAAPVVDVDFGNVRTNVFHSDRKGRFTGQLPQAVNDNFSGWSDVDVETQVRSGNGRKCLRFTTCGRTGAGGQFSVQLAGELVSGYYRLESVAHRVKRGNRSPIRYLVRLNAPTWKGLWSAEFAARDWEPEVKYFKIDTKGESPGLFLLTTADTAVDISRLTLTRITEEEFRATRVQNRPPADQAHYARHTRFPLGLPGGWNVGKDGVFDEVSSGKAEDGVPTLRFVSEREDGCLYSEPFLTSATDGVATVRIRYRAKGEWNACAFADQIYRWAGGVKLPPSATWREAEFVLKEPLDAEAMAVRFSGRGTFELDRFDVCRGRTVLPADPRHVAEVALQVAEGEIASTRIQFADEPSRLAWAVLNAPAGSVLRLSVTDIYGGRRALGDVRLSGGRLESGTVDYRPPRGRELGQFRVDAAVVSGGKRVSPIEELVVTRIARPVFWKRSAPDSPFGTHLIAHADTLIAAKAAGVNWTRFHDAGTEYSGWYDLEREKGKWTWHDEEINRFRDAGILMYAQLGTAPAWATRFAESRFRDKPNHYFAKYLRPTNTVDYLNYVTKFVSRYRGVIDDYFIWNEPWGGWWVGADDAKFYSTNKTELVRQYGEFSNANYAAAKAANPKARISGFNTVGGDVDWWMDPLIDVGVMDACDDIDFHYYTPVARLCEAKETPLSSGPLKSLRRRWPDLKGKRVIMSEGQGVSTGGGGVTGRMTGLYRTILPFKPESRDQYDQMADQTCRFTLDLLSEGVARIFVYTTHSYETMAVKPKFQSFFGADGYAHPELVAHSHMARLIEGRGFVRKESFGSGGVRLEFRGKDGSAVEAFTELTRAEAGRLAADHPGEVTDLYGNPLDPANWTEGSLVYLHKEGTK